jgi:hypothetical protein
MEVVNEGAEEVKTIEDEPVDEYSVLFEDLEGLVLSKLIDADSAISKYDELLKSTSRQDDAAVKIKEQCLYRYCSSYLIICRYFHRCLDWLDCIQKLRILPLFCRYFKTTTTFLVVLPKQKRPRLFAIF